MNENSRRPREPTLDDLRVKHCYICLEEERHDGRPNPPPIWTHPCKCTLIAHESCLLHWVNTQQRNFGRSRSELKCPQCLELYEFVDCDPTVLRVHKFANRVLSRSRSIVTGLYVGTTVVLFGAGIYMTCTTYGAFAVREFLGPDMFNTLLTTDPSRWPKHAWVNLPLIPFSLIAANTSPLMPFLFWTTSPLVPLLSPWPTSVPVAPHVARDTSALRSSMWPPPPALVCALFPLVRTMYRHLRDRVTRALVPPQVPARPEPIWRQQQPRQQRQLVLRRQEQLRWVVGQQERPQRRQQQQQQLPQQPQEQPNHDDFGLAAAARAIRVTDPSSIGHVIGGALAIPMIARLMGDVLLRISHVVPLVRIIIAPRTPLQPAAAVGGLLGLWDRARSAFRLFGGAGGADVAVVTGGYGGWLGGFGTKVLCGFLLMTQEWAMSDPVWWRNALGLGVFFVVKDGLKILHLRLANAQVEERKIRNRPFSGVNLTRFDLIERHT